MVDEHDGHTKNCCFTANAVVNPKFQPFYDFINDQYLCACGGTRERAHIPV